MQQHKFHIVVLGGGSAGWLTASLLAADHGATEKGPLRVTLIESPDIATIGVGEGTWPSMRGTLSRIGISESDLFRYCDASFKQGSLFRQWVTGQNIDQYYHPFTAPMGQQDFDLTPHWQPFANAHAFAPSLCAQPAVCDKYLAPKQIATPEYAFVLNYGYHLDAKKFADLLQQHATKNLGVKHIRDHVEAIKGEQNSPVEALYTKGHGAIEADLFIDCSGFNSVLIGKHYQVPMVPMQQFLFNDRALAAQLPHKDENAPLASCTVSTAHEAGWVWDIALPTRRGIGLVYSSNHQSADQAETCLRQYLAKASDKETADNLNIRQIPINSGYRQIFWQHNAVAVGLSGGFIEPLEASALVLIEMSARFISDNLPSHPSLMAPVAKAFNARFTHHWQQITDFLKLHYVLSKRDEPYWQDNRVISGMPESLKDRLTFWQHQVPSPYHISLAEELFPAASYQYVYYGMGGHTQHLASSKFHRQQERARQLLNENARRTAQLVQALPTNRALIQQIQKQGLPRL
ncbi:tryptophan 7-halogenase [Aliiglaciecola sp. CAU 1673]|uniref:tryptophan halogenase family protein n=1 Tax=Aliiglaciecola sp. CAU 1673 TaxID=3032595 RepID=UPI0023DB6CB3|nr:tryptophan halogenase family protein [Aliiglaciecola sp. CAU 1673]MDF2178785.1 tryptophan 7-halogenase [Aliiglaciecola sp. CAU 1673]